MVISVSKPTKMHLSLSVEHAQQERYDVAVVGAGPSGSAAAAALAQQGHSVLLIDRAYFPRDKACGDAIMPPALEECRRLGVFDEIVNQAQPIYGIGQGIIHGPLHVQKFDSVAGYILPRVIFDYLLVQHALAQHAQLLEGVAVEKIQIQQNQKSYALLQGYDVHHHIVEISAKMVIIANGSTSVFPKQMRQALLASPEESDLMRPVRALALTDAATFRSRLISRRTYAAISPRNSKTRSPLEFYFDQTGRWLYTWFFPVNTQIANIGILATVQQTLGQSAKFTSALNDFIAQEGRIQDFPSVYRSAPINTAGRGTTLVSDRMVCIGDAASMADPLSAEGISGALWSARTAAEVIHTALQRQEYHALALFPYCFAVQERIRTLHYEDRLYAEVPSKSDL